MSGESKPSLLEYSDLLPDERAKLEAKEGAIATMLLTDLGIKSGANWIASEDGRHRTIRLIVNDDTPRMVYELSEIELAEITSGELVEALRHALRQA